MEQENTNIKVQTITRKIRIYPNQKQIKFFKKCIDGRRYFANRTIEFLNYELDEINRSSVKDKHKEFDKLLRKTTYIRNLMMNKNSELVEEDLWQAQIPFDTREMAIRSVISMFKSAQSNKIAKNISKYNIKPIKKKENIQIFHVDDKTIKIKDGILKMFTEKLTKYNNTIRTRMRDKKKLKKLFQNKEPCDSIIQYIKDTNMWYICLPIKDV
jgi:hypothetical protein